MEASIGIITETWLSDGKDDLSLGAGLGMICHNRSKPAANGVTYSGVGIVWKESFCKFKEIKIENGDDFEVVAAVGSITGHARKLIVMGAYLPPNYQTGRANAALSFLSDTIIDIKRRYRDPFIVLGGNLISGRWRMWWQTFRTSTKPRLAPRGGPLH